MTIIKRTAAEVNELEHLLKVAVKKFQDAKEACSTANVTPAEIVRMKEAVKGHALEVANLADQLVRSEVE